MELYIHIPYCRQHDDLWVLNPGSIRDGSYGLITIQDGRICELKRI